MSNRQTQTEEPRSKAAPHPAANAAESNYVYAVILDHGGKISDLRGLDDQPVSTIGEQGLAFVVSEIDAERIRPERKYIAAHRAVLSKLMETHDAVLPMRFGLIASEPEIKGMIGEHKKDFTEQLKHVTGKIEMGLRASWDLENIFEFMVERHPELREMRDRVFGGGKKPDQDSMIEVGREFDRVLNGEREKYVNRLEEKLRPYCADFRQLPVHSEKEIMNLAFLVDKNRRAEFEDAATKAAEDFEDNVSFDLTGPWAPHAFAEVHLRS